ncbi:MAG: hypothetical protein JXA38_04075 [Methanosarcinaceae archaeon]|nr:hypothetical protein [Methanosarcinaceae archaeon]
MRIYHIALFFALIGVLTGMVDYIMIDAGGENWFEQEPPDMELVSLTSDDIDSIQFDEMGAKVDDSMSLIKYTNIFLKVLQGVFLIVTMLDDFLVYDVGGVNLFAPVLVMFQGVIYFIYITGAGQFILNRNMKGME